MDPIADSELVQARNVQVAQLQECGYDVEIEAVPLPKDPSGILVDMEMPRIKQVHLLQVRHIVQYDSAYYPIRIPLSRKRWQWLYQINEGREFASLKPESVELKLKERQCRGLTVAEGLALYRNNPNSLKKHSWFLIGSHHYRPKIDRVKIDDPWTIRMFPALSIDDWGKAEFTTRPANATCKDWIFPFVPLERAYSNRF